jgi:N-acetylmuramoyl-L-alanine amidase
MPRHHLLRAIIAVAVLLLVGQASFRASSTDRIYTVQPGDSLWAISVRYGVGLDDLAAANGMQLSDLLLIGRRLTIPGQAPTPIPVADAGDSPSTAASPITHSATPAPRPRHFSAAERARMWSFCQQYRPPTGPVGELPSSLLAHPERLALRPLFVHWGRVYHIKPDLLEAIAWQESGWQNDAVSSADAQGIGQLLPSTAAFVNGLMGTNLDTGVPSDNIRLEARYLALLLDGTGNRACEAVASYYQGFATLQHIGVLPESQVYVSSVLGLRPRFK